MHSSTSRPHTQRAIDRLLPTMISIPAGFALDERISHQSRGLLLKLFCQVSLGDDSASTSGSSEDLEELETAGYVRREDGVWIVDDPVENWMTEDQARRLEGIDQVDQSTPSTPRPSRPLWMTNIYGIAVKGTTAVKIGKAGNVEKRLRTLQTGHHGELVVLWSTQAPSTLEDHLHGVFEKRHIRGEWFDFPAGNAAKLIDSAATAWLTELSEGAS